MVRKQEQYAQAVEFRKRGFTYSEIAKITGVSKATVANWLGKQQFSKRVREDNTLRAGKENGKRMRLLNKARTNQNKRLYAEAERAATVEFKHFHTNPLFIAGLALYMGIGDMGDERVIRISTTRMEAHRIFSAFAIDFLGVPHENIRFWLLLYPDLDQRACIRAWQKHGGIKQSQFRKHQLVQHQHTNPTLHHGVGNTIIGSALLKRKLVKWIELASQEF